MTRRRFYKVAGLMAATVLIVRLWPRQPLERQIPLSTGVWSADGELLRVTLASDDQYRLWTPLDKISPVLADVFLVKEDRWYRWHPGFNPVALVRGAVRTWTGHGRQGGSTLTMQLARLMYRLNTRTPSGKLRQIAAALWLEARYSKSRLLEAYLNIAPFGGNVQGVGAASLIYFGKPASAITAGEAVTLAVIPQHPAMRAGRGLQEAGLLTARSRLAAQWLDRHGTSDSVRRQMELPIVAQARHAMPQVAPHFVDSLLNGGRYAGGRIDTTLDAGMQRLVERQIQRYLEQFGARGIENATALLVDSTDMSVKAWVGSADFNNDAIQGQVNGVLAKRSPGSTLKPFIYGLALDQGVLHPRTVLRDAPTSFGPFSPENFDGSFLGPVSAQEALIRSRNVPAVWTAMQIRQPNLYQFLSSAGISRLRPESFYGLALALGGGEVTMEELARLYATLANQGTLRQLRTTATSPQEQNPAQLLSPEASFIALDMLSRNPRPDDDGSVPRRNRWPVAWKTGTSWGFRDAWAAGVAGRYVLVVWIGDFAGASNPSFIGVDAAAPLFFRIVDALNLAHVGETPARRQPPPGVSSVTVCAESGDLPNALCPRTIQTWYIPGKSPIRMSQLHRAVAIDNRTGHAVCGSGASAGSWHAEVVEFWPSDMLKLFREAGMPRRTPPALPDCAGGEQDADAPRIASPLRRVTYALQGRGGDEVISLEAATAGEVREVFWFDGNDLIGNGPAQKTVAWRPASEGSHLIRIVDDHGRVAERDVEVQFTH